MPDPRISRVWGHEKIGNGEPIIPLHDRRWVKMMFRIQTLQGGVQRAYSASDFWMDWNRWRGEANHLLPYATHWYPNVRYRPLRWALPLSCKSGVMKERARTCKHLLWVLLAANITMSFKDFFEATIFPLALGFRRTQSLSRHYAAVPTTDLQHALLEVYLEVKTYCSTLYLVLLTN